MNRYTLTLLAALLGLSFPACAEPGGSIEGRVLEEGTDKPLANVIVIGRWQETRSSFADSQTVCVHVETATTDADGRFRLPTYRGNPPTLLDSYKPGYERSDQYYKTRAYVRHHDILKPFTGTKGGRLEYLSRAAISCSHEREIEIKLLPLYKALYEEARSIAETKEEKLKALYRLRDIERLELGSDKAWENFRQREKELK